MPTTRPKVELRLSAWMVELHLSAWMTAKRSSGNTVMNMRGSAGRRDYLRCRRHLPNDPQDEGWHDIVSLSGVHSSERSFDEVLVLRFAPLPKYRISVLSNYTAAALTDDSWFPTLSTASATWLCTASLVFFTTSWTSRRRAAERTLASSCWYGRDPALDPKRNPTPNPNRNDNFFTIWPFSKGFDLQSLPRAASRQTTPDVVFGVVVT
jgi:hypothetical protein